MNAGFRPPSRALILGLASSIALHLAVLFTVGSQPRYPAKMPGVVIVSRLVPPRIEAIAAPSLANQSDRARPKPRPHKTAVTNATVPVLAPIAALMPAPPSLPAPPQIMDPDLPIDLRVREVVVTSPTIYGLPEKYTAAGTELPYAWSDDIDTPPQATSMSRTRYPSTAGQDGLVLIRALLGTSGTIEDFEVLCGEAPFEDAARESVPSWAFVPPTAHGRPARAWMLLEFAFMKTNAEEGFDPSLADVSLATMRTACTEQLSASPR